MIRALGLGIVGLSLIALAGAQEANQGVRDLERELFGVEDSSDETAEDGELGEEELIPTQKRTYAQKNTVILRALDKITGRSTDFEMIVGEPKVYGSLRIDLQACYQTPPEEPPESAAFLKVTTANTTQVQTMAEPRDLTEEELAEPDTEAAEVRFSGWMFASSPGLNALEHPVYDIWVIACSAVDPSELEPLDPNE
ncbi:MAG: DUF2155 domain-containing protein [Pseudomonadota bacterium]